MPAAILPKKVKCHHTLTANPSVMTINGAWGGHITSNGNSVTYITHSLFAIFIGILKWWLDTKTA